LHKSGNAGCIEMRHSEGEPSETISTLTPTLSRLREREIWCIFPGNGRDSWGCNNDGRLLNKKG
jgi:hypothetical protein